MDGHREIRAMLFSVLHLPPLPAVVSKVDREDSTVLSDSEAESSHSLLGSLIDWCAIATDHRKNGERMLEQFELLAKFKEELKTLDTENCDIEDIYNFYCTHTRLWIGCYCKLGETVRFKPLCDVLNKDKLHRNMCDYTKAQYYHFTDGKESLELDADTAVYSEVLRKCATWTKEMML
jgi:hypothetical protein